MTRTIERNVTARQGDAFVPDTARAMNHQMSLTRTPPAN